MVNASTGHVSHLAFHNPASGNSCQAMADAFAWLDPFCHECAPMGHLGEVFVSVVRDVRLCYHI